MNILSIDAWSNGDDGWDWNAWYKVGTLAKQEFERIKKEEGFISFFIMNEYIIGKPYLFDLNDDGYNIVILNKETHEPLFAIEYGCHY